MCDEITYPFLNLIGASLGMDKQFHPALYNECNYLSMLGLSLIYDSKRDPTYATSRSPFGAEIGMAWCHQETSHYLSQCLPRSMWSCDVTKP